MGLPAEVELLNLVFKFDAISFDKLLFWSVINWNRRAVVFSDPVDAQHDKADDMAKDFRD